MKTIKLTLKERLTLMIISALSRDNFDALQALVDKHIEENTVEELYKAFKEIAEDKYSTMVKGYAEYIQLKLADFIIENK